MTCADGVVILAPHRTFRGRSQEFLKGIESMEYEHIEVQKTSGVAICTINNPPLNLLTTGMMLELNNLTQQLEADDEVRAVIFTGGVENVFILHFDVSELVAMAGRGAPARMPRVTEMTHTQMQARLESMPKPVIAAINGRCGGGGCEFALACDFRIMAIGDFTIGCPEVGVGILPGGGGTQRMTRLLGPGKALEMLLMGKLVGAEEAERIGLVHKAVPATELMSTASLLASRLAHGATVAQGLIKRCVYKGGELPLDEGLQIEFEAFLQTLQTQDAQAAMKAYLRGEQVEHKGR